MRRIRRLLIAGSLLLASAPIAAVQTAHAGVQQTGRASCRERVFGYV